MRDCENWKLDIKGTICSNLVWIFFLLIVAVYIFVFAGFLEEFTQENIKLLATIVFAFSTIKLLVMVGTPHIELKPREK